MKFVSRKTYLATLALVVLLAVALVLACTVYAAHAVAEGTDAHCDCPICRLFSVVGTAWALTVALTVLLIGQSRHEDAEARTTQAETPALSFVKLNC